MHWGCSASAVNVGKCKGFLPLTWWQAFCDISNMPSIYAYIKLVEWIWLMYLANGDFMALPSQRLPDPWTTCIPTSKLLCQKHTSWIAKTVWYAMVDSRSAAQISLCASFLPVWTLYFVSQCLQCNQVLFTLPEWEWKAFLYDWHMRYWCSSLVYRLQKLFYWGTFKVLSCLCWKIAWHESCRLDIYIWLIHTGMTECNVIVPACVTSWHS